MPRRRRWPLEALALPYECDGTCCADAYTHEPHTARPRQVGEAWEVFVYREGVIVDVFRAPELNEALVAVHCAYPRAKFDPEEGL